MHWMRDRFFAIQAEGTAFAEERLICLPCDSMEAGWRIGNDDKDRHNVEEMGTEQEAVEVRARGEGTCCVHNQLVKEGRGETHGGTEQAVPRQCEVK